MISIGLIGCGRWGKLILRDLKTLRCNVAVFDTSGASIDNFIEHHADRIVKTINEFEVLNVDGFIVATPTENHAAVIEKLIPYKKPIFTEKPLTNNLEAANKLIQKACDSIFVMDKWKYHNGIAKLAELVNTGNYGNIKQIILKRTQWCSLHEDVDPVWTLLPHDISIVQFLLGETPEAVYATGNILKKDYLNSLYAVLKAKDTRIIIETSADSVVTERSVSIVCKKGSLLLSNPYTEYILALSKNEHPPGTEPQKISFEPNMPLFDEISQFIKYLSDQTINLHSTATKGFETVRLITELRKMVFR